MYIVQYMYVMDVNCAYTKYTSIIVIDVDVFIPSQGLPHSKIITHFHQDVRQQKNDYLQAF